MNVPNVFKPGTQHSPLTFFPLTYCSLIETKTSRQDLLLSLPRLLNLNLQDSATKPQTNDNPLRSSGFDTLRDQSALDNLKITVAKGFLLSPPGPPVTTPHLRALSFAPS